MKSRTFVASAFFALVASAGLFQVACGSSSSPAAPMPPIGGGGGGSASVTVLIVGSAGSQAFTPNPVSVAAGQTVAFKNNDSTTHHIVQNGGAFDTGNLAPGATSAPIMIGNSSAMPFHCVIHPSMVGTINGSVASGPTGPGY